jgi:hypothetical protein
MIVKQFIVQFESDDSTRWLFSDRDLLAMLWHLNTNAGRAQTEGPEPANGNGHSNGNGHKSGDGLSPAILARRRTLVIEDLKAGPKALYMMLLEFSYERGLQYFNEGSIMVSVRRAAQMMNSSTKSITNWTKKLVERNLIWVSGHRFSNMWQRNVYHITALRPKGTTPDLPDSIVYSGGIRSSKPLRGKFYHGEKNAVANDHFAVSAENTSDSATNGVPAVEKNGNGQSAKTTTGSGKKGLRRVVKKDYSQSSKTTTASGRKASLGAVEKNGSESKKPAVISKALGQGSKDLKGGTPPESFADWRKRIKKWFPRELRECLADLVNQQKRLDPSMSATRASIQLRIDALQRELHGEAAPKSPRPVRAFKAEPEKPKAMSEEELLESARAAVALGVKSITEAQKAALRKVVEL